MSVSAVCSTGWGLTIVWRVPCLPASGLGGGLCSIRLAAVRILGACRQLWIPLWLWDDAFLGV